MKLLQAQFEFSRNLAKLILYCNAHGYEISFGELYRTQEQQDIYLKSNKTKVHHSQHQERLAVDITLFKDGTIIQSGSAYSECHLFWKSLNENNTGEFKNGYDQYHFEMRSPNGL